MGKAQEEFDAAARRGQDVHFQAESVMGWEGGLVPTRQVELLLVKVELEVNQRRNSLLVT